MERGFEVDYTMLYRWVQHYAPEMEKRMWWYYKLTMSCRWQIDETDVKVKGEWADLYQTIDKHNNTIDFYLSSTRNKKATKRFLAKVLQSIKPWAHPLTINTDKAPTFGAAIDGLKIEGRGRMPPKDTVRRQVKYLNNIVEGENGKLKRLINSVLG
ncbi:DDE domain-containing protein [Nitrosomonas ureae]|uniref:DDE domain-containing protein n=1 Tax=Nitrosomonas ureae TaxID=44577 RepID=A0A1H9A095_9PROT|nr:DDE domain-containing protein [Nitrosomonas ureae]